MLRGTLRGSLLINIGQAVRLLMKLKIWELSLIMAVVITILCGFVLNDNRQELSDKLIRLHVLANSDSEEDQAMKLEVRDAVLTVLTPLLADCNSQEEAAEIIGANIETLDKVAEETVGIEDSVTVTLTQEHYPTREYDTFSLPAGEYMSLRIQIGAAAGHNWWCVVFPPLCMEVAEETNALEASGLTNEEVALITEEDDGYIIKFKALEILDQIREMFR